MFAVALVPILARAEKVNVFLIGGQSNADGRAAISGLPTELQAVQGDIAIHWATAGNGSSSLNQSGYSLLMPGFSNSSGSFGPEVTFGRAMADFYADRGEHVALIKHAQGGTGLETHWQAGGDATQDNDGFVYRLFQEVVDTGMTNIQSAFPPEGGGQIEVSIEGMIWMQGEKDSNTTESALHYQANLTEFIGDVRSTYGTELPFVLGQLSANQIGTGGGATNRELVRSAQGTVATALSATEMVVTDTFGLKADNLHFSASGQHDLGFAFASQMQSLLSATNDFKSASFDFGVSADGNAYEQAGWTLLELPQSGAPSPQLSAADASTGWTVMLETAKPDDLRGRNRDPLDATTGGTLTLDDVYIDFVTGLETLSINNLDPAKQYDVQLIMFDDNASDGRTQTVTNITDSASDLLGTGTGPGGGSSLTSDLDFSVFGTGLSPDSNGDLTFLFANSDTVDRSLVNGLIITEVESLASADFDGNEDVDGADLLTWQQGLGLAGQTDNTNGDANGDGDIDNADLIIWQNQYGTSPGTQSAFTVVPEPSSLALCIVVGMTLVYRRASSAEFG
ncbi:sialate O-acetylesterase [Adhaeretor mobilis]|nr:sialate O-acetylesterase [Adhaeretor mobilis]